MSLYNNKAVALVALALTSAGDAKASESLYDYSIEELMQIEVISATQRSAKIVDVPAIVSVITADQIRNSGLHDLYEALRLLPGINLTETYYGYSTLNFRGVLQEHFNNKILVLVNGHATYDSLFGHSSLEYIPIEIVERIEVIRGPVSALHGTNAMAGSINIVTRTESRETVEVTARAGSDGYMYGNFSVIKDGIVLSGSIRDNDGYDYSGADDEFGNPVAIEYYNDVDNLFVDIRRDTWRFNAAYYQQDKQKLGALPAVWQVGPYDNENYYLDFWKTFAVMDGQLKLSLAYDHNDKAFHTAHFPTPASDPTWHHTQVDRATAKLEYSRMFGNGLDLIVGASYEANNSEPFLFESELDGSISPLSPYLDDQDFDNVALYGQVQYPLREDLTGILGLRWEDNSDTGSSDLIPRLGLVYRYSDDTNFKLLYGEAFRAPMFLEKYVDTPVALVGNPDIKREFIRTLEAGMEMRVNPSNQLQISTYYLEMDDEIQRRPIAGSTGVEFYNAPGRTMYGVEAQWVSSITEQTRFTLNASLKDGEEGDGDSNYISNLDFSAILEHQFSSRVRGSVIHNYMGASDYRLQSGERGETDAINLTDLSLGYYEGPLEVSMQVKNLFDEDYNYAEYVRRKIAEVPGGPERSYYLTFRYGF